MTLSGTATANTFTFNANSAKYTLTDGTLTVMTGGTANQSATIASAVALGGSQPWNVTSGTLAANGGISDGGGGFSLTQTGSGVLALGGAAGAVSYSGITTVNGGTLALTADNLFSYPSPFAPGEFRGRAIQRQRTPGDDRRLSGGGSNGGVVSLGSGGSLTFGNSTDAAFAGTITRQKRWMRLPRLNRYL